MCVLSQTLGVVCVVGPGVSGPYSRSVARGQPREPDERVCVDLDDWTLVVLRLCRRLFLFLSRTVALIDSVCTPSVDHRARRNGGLKLS